MPKNETMFSKALNRFGIELKGGSQGNLTEKRSSLENPQTPLSYPAEWLLDIFNGGRTDAGLRVSEMTALQVTTVYQCVMIIANAFATSPLRVMERTLVDKRHCNTSAPDHPLFDLLAHEPNEEMTSATWRRTWMAHKLLWGNAYSEIQRDKSNRIIAIWPRNPARTRPVRLLSATVIEGTRYEIGTMLYETFDPMIGDSQILATDSQKTYGYRRLVLAEDMLHTPGLSLDGRLGQDTIELARQAVGLALATEKYGAKFFGNGAIPTGLLTSPSNMTDIQMDVLKRSFMEAHGGENAQRVGVLPPGVAYTKTGATPEEGQMLETRQHQRLEIASVFNVPGHMVGVNGDDAGKSTVEQSSIEFKLFCLDAHIVDAKQELKRKLFPSSNSASKGKKFFADFDTRHLMYPDAASRSTLYGSGKQWGYMTTNDIRELEGMNPIDDGSGDKLWMPNNMVDAAMSATHADQVTDGLNDGTLAATPTNVTPIGDHPIVQQQEKEQQQQMQLQKIQAKGDVTKHLATQKANVAIAKHTGKAPAGGVQPGGHPQDPQSGPANPSAKMAGTRSELDRVFTGIFRDAVGRAANRKKATQADYATIFGPIVSAMAESAFDDGVDCRQFIEDYSRALFERRNEKWGDNLEQAAMEERTHLVAAVVR